MSTGAIVIIIAVIIVAAVVVLGPALLRQVRMRRQFGPEYDRLAKELGARKAAAELTARQRRVEALGIHPLSAEQQASYSGEWTAVQEGFVDSPAAAVSAAGRLIWAVMRDRGYPADDRNASMEALSVYHARSLDGYRQAEGIRAESASTEDLRKAMISYRALFQDVAGIPTGRGQFLRRPAAAKTQASTTGDSDRTRKIAILPRKTATPPRISKPTAGTAR
jgi:hypothetical protein